MRAVNQELTLSEIQEPPSIRLRSVLGMDLTADKVFNFCRIGVRS